MINGALSLLNPKLLTYIRTVGVHGSDLGWRRVYQECCSHKASYSVSNGRF